jgi:putative membrane protein
MFSAFALAQVQQEQPRPRTETDRPAMRMDPTQFEQQVRQFAQDPKTACDKLFVLHAGMGNLCEINAAQQAQQKATNPQVKQVAQQIIQDHQRANEQLRTVAQSLGVQLPTAVPEFKQQELQILAAQPADVFEKHYIVMMQGGHAANVIWYRGVSQLSKNEQVRNYAQQQLPVLSRHSEHIDRAAVALGLPGSNDPIPAAGRIEGQERTTPPSGTTPGQQKEGGVGGAAPGAQPR